MSKALVKVRRGCTRKNLTAFGVACLAIAVTAAFVFHGSVVAETPNPAIASAIETGKAFSAVTKEVSPAVVFIKATMRPVSTSNMQGLDNLRGQIPDELLKRFFGDSLPNLQGPGAPQLRPAIGQGSGFIISPDGYILTNNHVVGNANKLEVTLNDGRVFNAKLIGTDEHTDVAVIKIDAKDLPVLPMGNSDKLEVGEWVLAVGSPFGLTGTVTSGIVSAKGRDAMGITDYEDFIQTDAAINPGNSGGPLVNMQGQAVGINTAIMSRSGGYNGIGFAIPMNMAKQIVEQLIKNGSVTRGFLGVMIQPLTADLAASFKLDKTQGVLIADVTDGGPAAKAGLQRGDVVLKVNGKPVEDMSTFRNHIALVKPGTTVKLDVMRDGQQKTLSVKIGKLDGNSMESADAVDHAKSLGLSVQTLNKELADKLGVDIDHGVVITDVTPGSTADNQGLRPGMVIKELDHKPVKNAGEFADMVKSHKSDSSVLLLVQQNDLTRYVVLKFSK
jgi:serine protease Do